MSGRPTGSRRRGPNPLVVAAVTILLAAAITYFAFSGKQIPFVHHFTMHALVRNSVDIGPDSPVRIAGIDVGQVSGTSAQGTLTRIDFTVNSNGQPVHANATVTIRDRLFLEGSYYLQLDPGTPSAPIAKDGFTNKLKRLDPSKKPAEIDWVRDSGSAAGTTMLAIYEWVDDDTWRVCYDPSGKGRPKEFKTAGGTGYILHVWKRVK